MGFLKPCYRLLVYNGHDNLEDMHSLSEFALSGHLVRCFADKSSMTMNIIQLEAKM